MPTQSWSSILFMTTLSDTRKLMPIACEVALELGAYSRIQVFEPHLS
ncbi:MAG: hypothetical protein V7K38_07305 [Nostoc sp.]